MHSEFPIVPLLILSLGLATCGGSRVGRTPAQEGPTRTDDRFSDLRAEPPRTAVELARDPGRSTRAMGVSVTPGPAPGTTAPPAPALLPAAGVEAGAPELTPADIVAVIEVHLPGRTTPNAPLLARACLPLPNDFELPEGQPGQVAMTPLAFGAPDGRLVPCQIEVVTRGPSGRAEVIELLAPIELPAFTPNDNAWQASQYLRLPVHRGRFELPEPQPAHADVSDWLAGGPAALRAHDVHGNLYIGELLQPLRITVRAAGPYVRRLDLVTVMRPVVGNKSPTVLPHLFGVHAHVTIVAGDPRVALDLRIHAGLTSGAAEDGADDTPVGGIWFQQLELDLPPHWTSEAQFPDSAFGTERIESGRTRRTLVAPLAQGHLHCMPPAGQMQRRLVLRPRDARNGHPAWDGLGFPVPGPAESGLNREGWWSWSSETTACYLPQRVELPGWLRVVGGEDIGLDSWRNRSVERLASWARLVRAGSADGKQVFAAAMGWCHPLGTPLEGTTDAAAATLVAGLEAVTLRERAELERLALEHQLDVARHPVAMWLPDGRPAGLAAWRSPDGTLPFVFDTSSHPQPPELRLPAEGGHAPAAHLEAGRSGAVRPPYDTGTAFDSSGMVPTDSTDVVAWRAHPGEGLAPFLKRAEALAWLANDRLAIEDLRLEAERFRLMVHDAPRTLEIGAHDTRANAPAASASGERSLSLLDLESIAERRPHCGLPIDRRHALGLDAVVAAYALAEDSWREEFSPWLNRLTDTLLLGAMPNGLIARGPAGGLLGGHFDVARADDVAWLLHARRVLVEGVYRGVDAGRAAALERSFFRGVEYLCFGPPIQRIEDRQFRGRLLTGPAAVFAVAPLGPGGSESTLPPYSHDERWGEGFLPKGGRSEDAVALTYVFELLAYAEQWARAAGRPDAERYTSRALALGVGATRLAEVWTRMAQEDADAGVDSTANRASFLARTEGSAP